MKTGTDQMGPLNRRYFMSLAAGTAAAGFVRLTGSQAKLQVSAKKAKRPNVIFLLTDDQRWDTMGCTGNKIIRTPNMDDLATNGCLFTNCFVTTSICAASRASIFAGQYARRTGIHNFVTNFSEKALSQTYPMLLRAAGYRTGFAGKYGVGRSEEMPRDKYDFWAGIGGQPRYEHKDSAGNYKHLTTILTEQSIKFLDSCTAGQPFCLSVSFKAPHVQDSDPRQFIYDPKYANLYKDVSIPTPLTAEPKYFNALPEFLRKSEARRRWQMRFSTAEKYQQSVRGYYRLITGVDVAIGKIRAELARLGLAENTIIILMGDNGFYLGEHGLAGKWFPHEESIRVPLIIYDPRAAEEHRGLKRSDFTLNIDIAPTILDFADVPVPKRMQGRSLAPLTRGQAPKWRTDFFYEHLFGHPAIPKSEALRTGRYKYARYIDYSYEELYDLQNDPHETTNLADKPEHAELLTKLRNRCDRLRDQTR